MRTLIKDPDETLRGFFRDLILGTRILEKVADPPVIDCRGRSFPCRSGIGDLLTQDPCLLATGTAGIEQGESRLEMRHHLVVLGTVERTLGEALVPVNQDGKEILAMNPIRLRVVLATPRCPLLKEEPDAPALRLELQGEKVVGGVLTHQGEPENDVSVRRAAFAGGINSRDGVLSGTAGLDFSLHNILFWVVLNDC